MPIEMWGLINFYHAGERASRSSNQDDVNNPAKLVRELSSTVAGCDWLLQQFAELRELLEPDHAWEGHHKLKCIRLLGRNPLDCANVREVAEIFVATWSIRTVRGNAYSELQSELGPIEYKRFTKRVRRTWKNMMNAIDDENSRRILVSIVERAMARVKAQSAVARERAARDAGRRADCLLFDDSMEGERLRRYEASSSRTLLRSISEFFKVRRATETATSSRRSKSQRRSRQKTVKPSNNTGIPKQTASTWASRSIKAARSSRTIANEPNAATEQNFANEPNADSDQNFANEPNAASDQNSANEPNATSHQNFANEPNATSHQNFANEPNVDSASRTSPTNPMRTSEQNSTNEPNAASEQNSTNEPNVASKQNFANEPSDDDERDLDDRAADSPPARFGEHPHRDRDEGQEGRGGPGPIGERDRRVLENIPIPADSRVPELTHMIDFLKARAEIRRDLDEALDRFRQSIGAGEFGDSQSSIVKHPPTASLATIDADGVTSLADAEMTTSIAREFFRANPITQSNRG